MNKVFFLVLLTVLVTFNSCVQEYKEEEKYKYHQRIKNLLNASIQQNEYYRLYLKTNNKYDTVVIASNLIEKRLNILFEHGISSDEMDDYIQKKYDKGGFSVIELSAKRENKKVQSLCYKENSIGQFYYLIKTKKTNRTANFTHEMSFSSDGSFLILTRQKTLFTDSNEYRVEGKLIKD
jgi:hypothetical protein